MWPFSEATVLINVIMQDGEVCAPPTFMGGARRVNVKGSMVLSAYVHWKATCAEAIQVSEERSQRVCVCRRLYVCVKVCVCVCLLV